MLPCECDGECAEEGGAERGGALALGLRDGALADTEVARGGLIEESDARAINAPLIEQREQARLQLAALPSAQPPPTFDEVDPDAFRTTVLEAWHDRPLAERRQALDRVLDEVRLSPGGVHITYGMGGYHYHPPYGPPYAPMSFRVPSRSSYAAAGWPASTQGLAPCRWKSPA